MVRFTIWRGPLLLPSPRLRGLAREGLWGVPLDPGMGPRDVFFDFGGTLAASFTDPYPVFEEALRGWNISITRDRFERAFGAVSNRLGPFSPTYLGHPVGIVDRYNAEDLRELGVEDPEGKILRTVREAFTSPRWHRPYPETNEVLQEMAHRGLTLHLISNNTDLLPEVLSHLGWSDRFATVTFSQEAGVEKPDRRIFDLALSRARCDSGDAIHIGDSWQADYIGGTRAGLRAVWLNRYGADPPGPCEMIRDLREVPQMLDL